MTTVHSLLNQTLLPKNEARILLAYLFNVHLQLPKSALLTRDDMELSHSLVMEWTLLESRRMQGEPIAYLIGKRSFHAIDLHVAPGVLIPRPETELLVEIGLTELQQRNWSGNGAISDTLPHVLDLGTGSGAIALALAYAYPSAHYIATDASPAALTIAKRNAAQLQLTDRVSFFLGDWYTALEPSTNGDPFFDLILSNPPYIEANDPHLRQGDLRYEPESALTDHATGLSCLKTIIKSAPLHLKPGGLIVLEHGFNQSDAVLAMLAQAGLNEITPHRDLAGHWRVASARKPI